MVTVKIRRGPAQRSFPQIYGRRLRGVTRTLLSPQRILDRHEVRNEKGANRANTPIPQRIAKIS